jgi:hypothetical protein
MRLLMSSQCGKNAAAGKNPATIARTKIIASFN